MLDIGSGWGGLGLYLAEICGARVSGITLSEEQFALSRQRAEVVRAAFAARGLADDKVLAVGRGKRDLAIPTGDGVAEPRNRRVEILVR